MKNHFDICIVGAGLAGLHSALELAEAGSKVCVIDPIGIAGGASGTPVGLANPATGRYASRSWEAERSLATLVNRLDQIQAKTKRKFYKQTGVLRPALEEKVALKMAENIRSQPWEDGTVEWWDEAKVKDFHPGLNCIGGGVWVRGGLTIHIPDYLTALSNHLKEIGCTFILDQHFNIEQKNSWTFSFESGDSVTSEKIVFTTGIWSKEFDVWTHLKLFPVKGQTAIMQSSEPIQFEHAVSAMGYFSKIDDYTFILGSTYEHQFEHDAPDQKGMDYMFNRLQKVLPDLANSSKPISKWSGIRASTRDRRPLMGRHSTYETCYLFAGLGSKGLLYSAYGAKCLSNHILKGASIPLELDINRFTK